MAAAGAVGVPPAASKMQMLADLLALDFSRSDSSALGAAALHHLLPGLHYVGIAVHNPMAGSLVASANCAVPGPTTLHLHDPGSSAAGLALARGQPLQASLLDGAGAEAVAACTDVAQMVAQAPDVTHLLCLPFGCGGEEEAAEAAECQVHAAGGDAQGSGRGALLFGFAAPPALDARRQAALALLATLLPAPMARLSGDTLAFVNFATGSAPRCSCCCPGDSEAEEEEGEGAGEPCGPGTSGRGHDRDGSAPAQALPIPRAGAAAVGGKQAQRSFEDAAGPSSLRRSPPDADGKAAAKAAAAAAEEASAARLPRQPAPGSSPRFSKALLAAVEEEGGGQLLQQSPLTLAFRSPLAEAEYGRWVAHLHAKGDALFSALLLAALAVVAFVEPYHLVPQSPLAAASGVAAVLPLALSWLSPQLYQARREWLVVALRLYAVLFLNSICARAFQHTGALPRRVGQWLTCWRLTGAESLCVTAAGFRVRLQLHLSLQLAALAFAAYRLAAVCSECYSGSGLGACAASGFLVAAGFGYLLPTAMLYHVEQRSRALFASCLRAAARHEA